MEQSDKKYHTAKNQSGFTLLETVVALALLTFAFIAPLTLLTSSIANSKSSQNKIIAMNLAQEGIEAVRIVRDNNILCQDGLGDTRNQIAWDNLGNNRPWVSAPYAVDLPDSWGVGITCQPAGDPPPPMVTINGPSFAHSGGACEVPLLMRANGTYGYSGTGAPTIFKRCVFVQPPGGPDTGNLPDGTAYSIPAADILEVRSEVKWKDRANVEHIVELREKLYNWR